MSAVAVMETAAVKTDFQVGWDVYAAGGADSDCANREQVRGWWMALDADCTAGLCAQMGSDGMTGEQMDEVLDGPHGLGYREPADFYWMNNNG